MNLKPNPLKYTFTFFVFVSVILALDSKAQTQFTKLVYEQPYSLLHSDISVSKVDNGVLDFGRTYTAPFILKLDSTGEVKWSKSYSFDSNPSFSYLSACTGHDSTFAAVGVLSK